MNRLRCGACLLALIWTANSASAIDAYIVAGQSNGWRLSNLSQAPQSRKSSGRNVYYFGMGCVSEPETATMVTLTSISENSMGYGLAHALSDRAGEDIVFIQFCRCGAPVLGAESTSWWPGEDPAEGKTFDAGLFGTFQKYLGSVRKQVKDELNEELEIKGLFWHQGESNVSSDKAAFERAVTNLFGRFRHELGTALPIVAGHIRDLGEHQQEINAALDRVASRDPHTFVVSLVDIEFAPDRDGRKDVHIALAGCHELGRRMVSALSVLEIQAEVQKAGGTVELATDAPPRVIGIDLYNGNNPLKGKGGKNDVVNDEWLKKLAGVTSLKKLNLANCAVTNEGMQVVGQLTGLEELNLTLTAVSDEGLQHLRDLTHLRNLGLASSQCTGSGFAHLGKLKELENVNFHFTPLNDEGLRAISAVGVKNRLWFAHVKFTDAGAASLAQLKQLKICGMGSNNPESSGKAVESLVGLPLEDLSLLDNQASPEGIAFAAKIKSLRKLDVAYAPKATDESLALVAQLPNLEEFRIGSAAEITDKGIAALADAKSLKKLSLQQLRNVTEKGVAALKQARPDLIIDVK